MEWRRNSIPGLLWIGGDNLAKQGKTSTKKRAEAPVSAAMRVLSVLEALSRESSMSLEDLTKKLKLAKPTIYRFLLTLQASGYARRDESERWAITLKNFQRRLPSPRPHRPLQGQPAPIAEELAAELGEDGPTWASLEGDSAVYILKIESKYTIRMYSRIGRRIPPLLHGDRQSFS